MISTGAHRVLWSPTVTDQIDVALPGKNAIGLDPDEIHIGRRTRQSLGNIEALAYSIEQVGQKDPVILTEDRRLVSGYRRVEACRILGIPVKALCSNYFPLVREHLEREGDTAREQLLPSEEVSIARILDGLWEVSGPPPGDRRESLAKAIGRSGFYLRQARRVVEAAEAGEPYAEDAMHFMDSAKGNVHGAFRRVERIDPSPRKPFVVDSERHKNIAIRNRARLWSVVNGANAFESVLRDFDVTKGLALASPEEVDEMVRMLATSTKALRRLRKELIDRRGQK